MTQREADYEAVTLQKLRAMEDLLKSFMDRLKEPTKKKGVEVSIHATITGRIHWYVSALQPVKNGEDLCRINSTEHAGEFDDVSTWTGGILFIEQGADEGELVSRGDRIATIVQESDFYPE